VNDIKWLTDRGAICVSGVWQVGDCYRLRQIGFQWEAECFGPLYVYRSLGLNPSKAISKVTAYAAKHIQQDSPHYARLLSTYVVTMNPVNALGG
jgi:hypothetical protein